MDTKESGQELEVKMDLNICKAFLKNELKTKSLEKIMQENSIFYRLTSKNTIKKLVLQEAYNKLVQEKDLNVDNIEQIS